MKNYEKPIVKLEEEKAEGVYMASGDSIDGNNSGKPGSSHCQCRYSPDTGDWKRRLQNSG